MRFEKISSVLHHRESVLLVIHINANTAISVYNLRLSSGFLLNYAEERPMKYKAPLHLLMRKVYKPDL